MNCDAVPIALQRPALVHGEGGGWLDRAVQLNPNYAQAVYLRALTQTLIGDGQAADPDVLRNIREAVEADLA